MTETTWQDSPRLAALTATKEYEEPLGARDGVEPLFPWVECQLTGVDGNAFAIIAAVARALKDAGLREEAEAYNLDAMDSPSYDALIQHAMKTVEVS